MEKIQYWQLCGAIGGFWLVILVTSIVAFYAGRLTVQFRVDVAPADVTVAPANVTVQAAKPAPIEVNVPAPVVNVTNEVPHGPAPVVNVVAADEKAGKVERVEGKRPVAAPAPAPVVSERDPEGKLLPPPKSR